MKLYIGTYLIFWGEIMKNSKGNILISLLFVLIILSILSVGAYQIVYSAIKGASYNEDRLQAYYIAKSAADIVIENIYEIRNDLNDNSKSYSMAFSNGEAVVVVSKTDENKLRLDSKGSIKGSESSVKADIMFHENSEEPTIFAVSSKDKKSIIYSIVEDTDGNFMAKKIKNAPELIYPKALAWNYDDKIILVGGDNGNDPKALVYDVHDKSWDKVYDNGNGFVYGIYSVDEKRFYAVEGNNKNGGGSGKVKYLSTDNKKWITYSNDANRFNGKKLAQGNKISVLIDEDRIGKVFYINKNINESGEKSIRSYGMEGTYKSTIYGNKKFIVVGYEDKDYPIMIYSDDGMEWYKGNIIDKYTSEINYELNDVIWTGEKFVAVGGAGTILISDDGVDWWFYPRSEITKANDLYGYGNYLYTSAYDSYIVAVNDNSNRILVSKDGGESWVEKKLEGIVGKVVDIIVVNKGAGSDASESYSIKWSE